MIRENGLHFYSFIVSVRDLFSFISVCAKYVAVDSSIETGLAKGAGVTILMAGLASEMLAALRSHEDIFRYWKGLRRRGKLPSRQDLDPGAIRRRLPTISLIDVLQPHPSNNPCAFRQRLAGTELFTAYGEEITGKTINAIYTAEEALYWAEHLTMVVETGKPNVGLHSMAWRGAKSLSLFWLRLPLASDGVNVDMILGHDALIGKIDLISHTSGIKSAS